MGRLCTVCTHIDREEIDAALLVHAMSYPAIGRRFGLHRSALQQHERNHLRMSWQESKELGAMLSAENLLAKLASLDAVTLELLAEARTQGDLRTALAAVRESRGNIDSYSRIGPVSELEQRLAALEEGRRTDDGHAMPS